MTSPRMCGSSSRICFPDGADLGDLPKFVDLALGRIEHCFSRVRLKGFFADGEARFSHLALDQYAIFLYYLANTAFREKPGHPDCRQGLRAQQGACTRSTPSTRWSLPDVFAVQHPVGTVLGRASYSDYFICYHNCTVGANLDNDYPSFGRGIVMYGGSRVIGKTAVGDNTFVSTGAIIIDGGALARRQRAARHLSEGRALADVAQRDARNFRRGCLIRSVA